MNLVFRPVRPDDKARVLDITANTWSDGDYIQYVFEDWLADATGQFTAVELDGQVVAIGKLTDLGDGELWLEGLRVDPARRKRGIGEALHNYNVDLAKQMGGRVLRYATGEDNTVSKLFAERTGFRHVGRYRWHTADASTEFSIPARLSPTDRSALEAWLDSPLLRSARGLYARSWRWATLSASRLKAHLEAGHVFGLRRESGPRAYSICEREEEWGTLAFHHLDGIDPGSMVEIAQALRGRAADAKCKTVEGFGLDPSPQLDALRAAGYRAEEHAIIVFELPFMDE